MSGELPQECYRMGSCAPTSAIAKLQAPPTARGSLLSPRRTTCAPSYTRCFHIFATTIDAERDDFEQLTNSLSCRPKLS